MIIKEADDKSPDFTALRALLARPECSPETGKQIEREIRNMQAGIRAETEAAYEMKVHLGVSRNFAIIHDLRVEHEGLVAQIDHLIINRLLKIWVCESKSFSEGISINEHGEFAAFYGGKPYGVPSPIEQNRKHILILQRMFDAGVMPLPTRLGFKIQPDLQSMVIVSKGARISRPINKLEGLDCIVKSDQTVTRMQQREPSALLLGKVIGQDTLADFAQKIAKEHRPIRMDWRAKFGVPSALEPSALSSAAPAAAKATESRTNGNSNLACYRCGKDVGYDVAKFCRFNKSRFGGNIFCRACQATKP